ncbi:helix-turn-helix domain-containing protein [Anaerotignum sp.]|uniref:helix-turn-helix domain-containing protein n=1 Tax=Anaerotignum sp. TaxID=2039241 RepID=UPI0028B0686A|nr:helix-turn-helix transcriptional regulator [Anaerotignum sp.]
MELNYDALGERIHRLRKEKGITQSFLAERVGIEPSNISHIERAASKVGLGTLVKIANVLECSVDDLLCDSIICEREAFENDLLKITADCSQKELRMITDLVYAMKVSMRKREYDARP